MKELRPIFTTNNGDTLDIYTALPLLERDLTIEPIKRMDIIFQCCQAAMDCGYSTYTVLSKLPKLKNAIDILDPKKALTYARALNIYIKNGARDIFTVLVNGIYLEGLKIQKEQGSNHPQKSMEVSTNTDTMESILDEYGIDYAYKNSAPQFNTVPKPADIRLIRTARPSIIINAFDPMDESIIGSSIPPWTPASSDIYLAMSPYVDATSFSLYGVGVEVEPSDILAAYPKDIGFTDPSESLKVNFARTSAIPQLVDWNGVRMCARPDIAGKFGIINPYPEIHARGQAKNIIVRQSSAHISRSAAMYNNGGGQIFAACLLSDKMDLPIKALP